MLRPATRQDVFYRGLRSFASLITLLCLISSLTCETLRSGGRPHRLHVGELSLQDEFHLFRGAPVRSLDFVQIAIYRSGFARSRRISYIAVDTLKQDLISTIVVLIGPRSSRQQLLGPPPPLKRVLRLALAFMTLYRDGRAHRSQQYQQDVPNGSIVGYFWRYAGRAWDVTLVVRAGYRYREGSTE